jgi:hypothetical protein
LFNRLINAKWSSQPEKKIPETSQDPGQRHQSSADRHTYVEGLPDLTTGRAVEEPLERRTAGADWQS